MDDAEGADNLAGGALRRDAVSADSKLTFAPGQLPFTVVTTVPTTTVAPTTTTKAP